ncbi:hypothetical protein [Ekhidna sp.]
MKYLSIIFLLFAGILNAQTTFTPQNTFENQSLNLKMDRFSTRNLYPLQLNLPNRSVLNQQNDQLWITAQQINLTACSIGNVSEMNDLLLGTSLSNTVQLGKRKIQTTYIFDMHGDLRGYESSFSIGRKRSKKLINLSR